MSKKELIKLIEEKGFTYSSLSKIIGITDSNIAKWFNIEKRRPSLENEIKLSNVLEMTLDELRNIAGWGESQKELIKKNTLKHLVYEKGLTLSELGRIINAAPSTVLKWNLTTGNKKEPSTENKNKIAKVLDMELDALQEYCKWKNEAVYTSVKDPSKLKEMLSACGHNARSLARGLNVAEVTAYSWTYKKGSVPNLESQIKIAKLLKIALNDVQDFCGWPVTDDIKIIKWD